MEDRSAEVCPGNEETSLKIRLINRRVFSGFLVLLIAYSICQFAGVAPFTVRGDSLRRFGLSFFGWSFLFIEFGATTYAMWTLYRPSGAPLAPFLHQLVMAIFSAICAIPGLGLISEYSYLIQSMYFFLIRPLIFLVEPLVQSAGLRDVFAVAFMFGTPILFFLFFFGNALALKKLVNGKRNSG